MGSVTLDVEVSDVEGIVVLTYGKAYGSVQVALMDLYQRAACPDTAETAREHE